MRAALVDGIARVNRAPALLVGVWAMTVLVTLPLVVTMRGEIAEHLGSSLAAGAAVRGVNYDWMQEFSDQAKGVGTTFKPTIIGLGAVLDNLSAFLDNVSRPAIVAAAAAAYIGLWIFLAGGILDRYARQRPTRAHGFFGASGVFFFRFLRLGAAQWAVYAFLFGSVHPLLLNRVYSRLTHEVAVERTAFLIRIALYAVFVLLVAAAALVFDYAKVRAVVEDRRSALGAIAAAVGFIRRNAPAAVGLFALNAGLFVMAVALYAFVAPGAGGGGASVWVGLAIGQLYVIARLWVKLVFWASETALFQGRLAHAGYVARREASWPESPIVETVRS